MNININPHSTRLFKTSSRGLALTLLALSCAPAAPAGAVPRALDGRVAPPANASPQASDAVARDAVNENFRDEAERKVAEELGKLARLTAVDPKPRVLMAVEETPEVIRQDADLLMEWVRRSLGGAVEFVDDPKQADEKIVIRMALDPKSGKPTGSCRWLNLRIPGEAPQISASPIGSAFDVGDRRQAELFRLNIPVYGKQLAARMLPDYVNTWPARRFVSIQLVGLPEDVQLAEDLRGWLAKRPGVTGKPGLLRPADKPGLTQLRIPGTPDLSGTAADLQTWLAGQNQKFHALLTDVSRSSVTLKLERKPFWQLLTDPAMPDALRERLDGLAATNAHWAVVIEPPDPAAAPGANAAAAGGNGVVRGGLRAATLLGHLGNALRPAGPRVVDIKRAQENLDKMVAQHRQVHGPGGVLDVLSRQQDSLFQYALVCTLHTPDIAGQYSMDVRALDLRRGERLAFFTWEGKAPPADAVNPADFKEVSRYIAGQILEQLASASNLPDLFHVYVKGATADQVHQIADLIQRRGRGKGFGQPVGQGAAAGGDQPDADAPVRLAVDECAFEYGLGRLQVRARGATDLAIRRLLAGAQPMGFVADRFNPGIVELNKVGADGLPPAAPSKPEWAALVVGVSAGVSAGEHRRWAPLRTAQTHVARVSQLLSQRWGVPNSQMVTLADGLAGSGAPAPAPGAQYAAPAPARPDIDAIQNGLRQLARTPAGNLVVYYTGRALSFQVSDGVPAAEAWHLVPAGANGNERSGCVSVDQLMQLVAASGAKNKAVLLECYLTPGEKQGGQAARAFVAAVESAAKARGVTAVAVCHDAPDAADDAVTAPEEPARALSHWFAEALAQAESANTGLTGIVSHLRRKAVEALGASQPLPRG